MPNKTACETPKLTPLSGNMLHVESSVASGTLKQLAHQADASMCLQCHKCTAGCPLGNEMDFPPSKVVRLVQLNQKSTLMSARSIWLCTSCHTCSDRCPAGVKPSIIQDGLRRISTLEGNPSADPRAESAAVSFLWSVEKSGRINELQLARRFKFETKTYFEMIFLGITMFLRGKLKLLKQKIRRPKPIAATIRAHMRRSDSKE